MPSEGRVVNPQDRKRLEDLRFAPEVIARTEEVLRVWGEPALFATCSYCGKVCLHPDLPRGKHLRKKLPADLYLKRELIGFRDHAGEVICLPCDDFQFEYG
jgi:hypothetical protein